MYVSIRITSPYIVIKKKDGCVCFPSLFLVLSFERESVSGCYSKELPFDI